MENRIKTDDLGVPFRKHPYVHILIEMLVQKFQSTRETRRMIVVEDSLRPVVDIFVPSPSWSVLASVYPTLPETNIDS